MAKPLKYNDEIERDIRLKLNEIQKELPKFCRNYFIGLENTTLPRTRLGYAYDIRLFFQYLIETNPVYSKIGIRNLEIKVLEEQSPMDIEEYMIYLKCYTKDGVIYTNNENGIKRKMSAIRSLYAYFFKKEIISSNPTLMVSMPKLHEKAIIRLEANEIVSLLDVAESGMNMTKKQLEAHKRTKTRDVAILTLLLGTGMRVSECVGIDIGDVSFEECQILVHRKGGKEVILYFGDEVEEALRNYMFERNDMHPAEGSENALFLSLKNSRISVRSVELLVKKYSMLSSTVKHITPHKLRSTYGTRLYEESGDIYLVADVLGHKDVNTTRRHYAAIDEERRRSARNQVRLRED
ncbi:MAG: tyrosine-type recombinase/integrase [Lachnospiraceae bacterium]|nr:tyrosine-type recombinase/integrase [Lachnospiraceae bacterium]